MTLWGNHYRHVILLVGFFCLASIASNFITINFALVCMAEDMSETLIDNNGTLKSIYAYNIEDQKYIQWAHAAGTMIGVFPIAWFYNIFGAKQVFLAAGLTSSLATVFIPLAAKLNFLLLLLLRFFQGLAYAADFAAIGLMTVRWAPLNETALFIATLTCFTGIATLITNSVTGIICKSVLGWKYAFYLHAAAGFLLFLLWTIIYVEDPQETKRISGKELSKIHKNKSAAHLDKTTAVPYKKILTSLVIWVVWLNAFFEMALVIMYTTYLAIYFHVALEFGIRETGFLTSLIMGFNIPLRVVAALGSDKITFFTERLKIRCFNTISVGISGLIICSVGFIPKENRYLSTSIFFMSMICISLNSGGFYKCGALHARQFSHVVISAIQFMKCVALFVCPAIYSFFVNDPTNQNQWIPVWIILGSSMFIANFISLFVFTDKPAEWTESNIPDDYKQIELKQSNK